MPSGRDSMSCLAGRYTRFALLEKAIEWVCAESGRWQRDLAHHCRHTRGSTNRCNLRSSVLNIFTSTSAGSADMGVSGCSSCISGVSSDTGIKQRRFLLLLARPGEFVSKLRRWRTRPLLGPAADTEG